MKKQYLMHYKIIMMVVSVLYASITSASEPLQNIIPQITVRTENIHAGSLLSQIANLTDTHIVVNSAISNQKIVLYGQYDNVANVYKAIAEKTHATLLEKEGVYVFADPNTIITKTPKIDLYDPKNQKLSLNFENINEYQLFRLIDDFVHSDSKNPKYATRNKYKQIERIYNNHPRSVTVRLSGLPVNTIVNVLLSVTGVSIGKETENTTELLYKDVCLSCKSEKDIHVKLPEFSLLRNYIDNPCAEVVRNLRQNIAKQKGDNNLHPYDATLDFNRFKIHGYIALGYKKLALIDLGDGTILHSKTEDILGFQAVEIQSIVEHGVLFRSFEPIINPIDAKCGFNFIFKHYE